MAVIRTGANDLQISHVGVSKDALDRAHVPTWVLKERMDQWLVHGSDQWFSCQRSAKGLEVAGPDPVHCHFSLPPSLATMCKHIVKKSCL